MMAFFLLDTISQLFILNKVAYILSSQFYRYSESEKKFAILFLLFNMVQIQKTYGMFSVGVVLLKLSLHFIVNTDNTRIIFVLKIPVLRIWQPYSVPAWQFTQDDPINLILLFLGSHFFSPDPIVLVIGWEAAIGEFVFFYSFLQGEN
eukprot:TRINITY_DN6528_c0_g1_i7.p10 TRINITY_DN6528_c0_g1~~TRINITY_DN6528_c0_g1_i7.p10  ORF type:complete len:148 (-),score=0.90 TRINITY_DN6528_c0_g1_i7:1283-1726(-)